MQRCILLAAAFVCCAISVYGDEGLLRNGDFEDVDNGALAGWKFFGKDGVGVPSKDGQFPHGIYSAYLKSQSSSPDVRVPVKIYTSAITDVALDKHHMLTFFARGQSDGQPLQVFYYTDPIPGDDHWYKRKEIILTKEWKKYTFDEYIPAASEWKERKLSIVFQIAYGAVFIDDVDLRQSAKKEAEPALARKNMLVNPGFDTGVNGWFVETWHSTEGIDERAIEVDHAARHDGVASLKMPGLNHSIISPLMPFAPGKTYTLSLYARSEETGTNEAFRMFLITPAWKISKRVIALGELTKEWKRFSFEFKEGDLGTAYENSFYVRIDPTSTVWIDSVQLEEGPLTAYDPGFQVGMSPRTPLGLYTKGEGVFDVVVTAPDLVKDAVVNVAAVDVFGNVILQRSIAVPKNAASHVLPVTVSNERFGVVDVSLALAYPDAFNEPLAVSNWRYTVVDTPLPRNPLFGVDLEPASVSASEMKHAEHLGSYFGDGFQRTFMRPGYAPRSRFLAGDDAFLDVAVAMMDLQKGKRMMTVVNPPADSPLNFHMMLKSQKELSDAERAAETERFGRMLGHIVERLKGNIEYFEILNEPNIWIVKGEKVMPAEEYAKILQAVAPYARKAYPGVKLAANVNGIDLAYVEKLMAAGAGEVIDVFTIHPYRGTPENPPIYEEVRQLREILDRYKKGMPIINSEQYYGVRNMIYAHEYARSYYADFEDDCAGRILQTYLHGVAADGLPFCLLGPGSDLFKFGPFESVYPYYLYGMLPTTVKITTGVRFATNLQTHPACRAFLFEKADGTKTVSITTRLYETRGSVRRPTACSGVLDANGNTLAGNDIPVRYLPVYLLYTAETSRQTVVNDIRAAAYAGFDFPLAVRCDLTPSRSFTVDVRNTENAPIECFLKFTKVPDGFPSPGDVPVSLAAGASKTFTYHVGRAVDWRESMEVSYIGKSGDHILSKSVRLPTLYVGKAKKPVIADGDVGEWDGAEWLALDERQLSKDFAPDLPHRGADDLSADVSLQWDEEALHIAVKVKDDIIFRGTGGEGALYADDSVQVYFDLKNSARENVHDYDSDDVVYTIGLNRDGKPVAFLEKSSGARYVGVANEETGIDGDVRVGHKRTNEGYTYELSFPSSTLPFLALGRGNKFGFSILINDNDGKGRKQGLTIGPKGGEPYQEPFLWRCSRLCE